MVYAFLAVVTPMHDLLVTVALVFFLVAMVAVLWVLRSARQNGLLWLGALCLAVLLACGGIYYGTMLDKLLAVMLKVVFVTCVGWYEWLPCSEEMPTQGFDRSVATGKPSS